MNFRVNLAVACAAALSFACADKQAAIPELEEAMKAPPGMRVIGLYKMTVTPVETREGLQFAFQPIAVGRDGNPLTNPPNTVQVSGVFGQPTTAGPGGCAGITALTAAVRITNFMVDPLRNVWVDVIDMSGNTGNTACNSTSSLLSETNFAVSDMSQGIWKYADLAGAPSSTGQTAGGTSLPLGGAWGFRYVTLTPFQFYFRVAADDQAPVLTYTDPAGPNIPLTWTSAVAANTRLEMCSVLPGIGEVGDPCPVALTVDQAVAGTGAGPWTFSFTPTGLTPGATYWWRARNVFPAGVSTHVSMWNFFTYSGSTPAVTNAAFLANVGTGLGTTADLTWTTISAQTDTWLVLCAGPCPATRPAGVDPAVLVDQAVAWDFFPAGAVSNYVFDALPFLATDPSTVTYLDPTVTYDWRVYDYDGFSPPPAFGAAHSTGTITITPVSIAPVVTSEPAAYSLAAGTWPVSWTADPLFTTTTVSVCAPDCANPIDLYLADAPITNAAGSYSLDLFAVLVTNAGGIPVISGDTFELFIQNPDLVGVWGTSVLGTVVP